MGGGWLSVRSQPVCSPQENCSQFGRPPVTLTRTKPDKTRPCFTLSHGDASWDALGEERGASPTPGTSLCPHTPVHNHTRSCSL